MTVTSTSDAELVATIAGGDDDALADWALHFWTVVTVTSIAVLVRAVSETSGAEHLADRRGLLGGSRRRWRVGPGRR